MSVNSGRGGSACRQWVVGRVYERQQRARWLGVPAVGCRSCLGASTAGEVAWCYTRRPVADRRGWVKDQYAGTIECECLPSVLAHIEAATISRVGVVAILLATTETFCNDKYLHATRANRKCPRTL